MRIDFTHPVMATASEARTGDPKLAVGTVVTEIEFQEHDAAELVPAFEFGAATPHLKPIFEHGGTFWRASSAKLDTYGAHGFAMLASIVNYDVCQPFEELRTELMLAVNRDARPVMPKPSAAFLNNILDTGQVIDFLGKAGPLTRRRVTDIDEVEVEACRERIRTHLSSYALFDGRVFERCHEPALAFSGGRIQLRNMSYHQRYANRRSLTRGGLPEAAESSAISTTHIFPADGDEAIMSFAERVKPDFQTDFFQVICNGPRSTPEEVIERESVRFASLQINQAYLVLHGQKSVEADISHLEDYAASASLLGDAARGYVGGHVEHEALAKALNHTSRLAAEMEKTLTTERARSSLARLTENTEWHLSRVDELTVSLVVPFGQRPR